MIKSNVISGTVCFLFGAFAFWLAQGVPPVTLTDTLGGRFFPQIIAVLFMIASAGLVITGLRGIEISGGTVAGASEDGAQEGEAASEKGGAGASSQTRFGPGEKRLLAFIATMFIYTLVLPLVGYIPASLVTFAVMIAIVGERRPLRVALGAGIITGMLYLLFAVVFNMNVPEASLF